MTHSDDAAIAPTTRIDAAWLAASQGEDETEAARFMDVVLAEPLLCPVWDEEDDAPPPRPDALDDAETDTIAPKMIDMDGVETVTLFDTEERLAEFAGGPCSFVALTGAAFFEMAAENSVQIALNLDVAMSATVFDVDTVSAMSALATAGEEVVDLSGGPALTLTAPANASEAMLAALAARLGAATDIVVEAWLVDLTVGAAEDDASDAAAEGRPVLAMAAAAGRSDEADALARDLARLAGSVDPNGLGVDVMVTTEDDLAFERARAVGFGLLAKPS